MKTQYGVDSMPETAENVATDHKISREAIRTAWPKPAQRKALAAQQAGCFDTEIVPVTHHTRRRATPSIVARDEHPRATPALEALGKLKGVVRP